MWTDRRGLEIGKLHLINRLLLFVVFLLIVLDLWAGDKNKNAARLGKLLITAQAVQPVEALRAFGQEGTPVHPRTGYSFVLVRLKVKNIGNKRAIREWLGASLRTDFGLEYNPTMRLAAPPHPETYELLPGEEVEGSYIFEIKESTRPIELVVRRMADDKRKRISLKDLWGAKANEQR